MSIAASNTSIRAIVPKTVAATIDRLATASGKSRSATISEFLTEVEPAMRRLAGMLEVAMKQRQLFPKSAVADLEAALDELSGSATEVMDRIDRTLQLPLDGPQKRSARRRTAAGGRPHRRRRKDPRLVTRG